MTTLTRREFGVLVGANAGLAAAGADVPAVQAAPLQKLAGFVGVVDDRRRPPADLSDNAVVPEDATGGQLAKMILAALILPLAGSGPGWSSGSLAIPEGAAVARSEYADGILHRLRQ